MPRRSFFTAPENVSPCMRHWDAGNRAPLSDSRCWKICARSICRYTASFPILHTVHAFLCSNHRDAGCRFPLSDSRCWKISARSTCNNTSPFLLLCSFMSFVFLPFLLRIGTLSDHPRKRSGMIFLANFMPNLLMQRKRLLCPGKDYSAEL